MKSIVMRFFASVLLPVAFTSGAFAQTAPHWSVTPYIHCSDPVGAAALFGRARTETVRFLYLGDSQETSPAGQGYIYIPRLGMNFSARYGNCPETPVQLTNFISQIVPEPAADFLTISTQGTPGPSSGITPAGWLPPHLIAARYGTQNVNAGNLVSLEQNGEYVYSGVQLTGAPFFDTSAGVELEVFATTLPTSGDVRWYAKPSNSAAASYGYMVTQSGTLGLTLSNSTLSVLSGTTGLLNFAGNSHMHVELCGTSDANPTQIIGSRFRSLGNQTGIVVSSFSAGGYQVSHFLNNHAQSGPVLQAMGFDAVMVGYGANESGILTPEQFKVTLENLITWLRTNLSSDIWIILACDPYSPNAGSLPNYFEHYAGVGYEIAQSYSRVISLNGRRATEDVGWGETGTPTLFMFDGVHYTPLGGRTKADVEVGLLDTYIDFCYANCDGSTGSPKLTANDFSCFLNSYASAALYANCDGSTIPPVLNANDFLCFLNKFSAGCP